MSEAQPPVRLRLDVCYDGTGFSGWAVQPGRRTVCGVLTEALTTLLRAPVTLTVAGRTDAGVHASGQVAHLDVRQAVWDAVLGAADASGAPGEYPASPAIAAPQRYARVLRRLARLLPADVRVRAITEVPPQFDARFAALWRRYEYRICDRPEAADPLRRSFVHTVRTRLDADAMADAAGPLLGLHDFAAFCRRREGATTIRTLQRLGVARDPQRPDEIVIAVRADAFCHNMVRSLVGALIAVGQGRRTAAWLAGLPGATERSSEITVAPAHGLTLVEVGYPEADGGSAGAGVGAGAGGYAARAAQTRATRSLPPRSLPPKPPAPR